MGVDEGNILRIDSHVLLLLFHIQRIGCQPEKNYFFTRSPIPLVVY